MEAQTPAAAVWGRPIGLAVALVAEAFFVLNAVVIAHRLMEVDPFDGTPMRHALVTKILVSPYWQWGMTILGGSLIAWLAMKRPLGAAPYTAVGIGLLAAALVTFAFG
jgi:hypothetical protein